MIFHDIEQNTDEWLALRAGKITGSGVSKIMANLGKAFGEPAKKYAATIALEQITGNYVLSGFSNDHTDRGHEQEPYAREAYEHKYFVDVTNGGFFEIDDTGCSPDGLVNSDGLIEIKSVIATTHYLNIKRQSFDPTYKWQLISNLYFTNREWIDFVSYCVDFPENYNLFVYRMHKNDFAKEFGELKLRMNEFRKLIVECKKTIKDSSYLIDKKRDS